MSPLVRGKKPEPNASLATSLLLHVGLATEGGSKKDGLMPSRGSALVGPESRKNVQVE